LTGSVLIGASFAAIYYVMSKVVENALHIAEKYKAVLSNPMLWPLPNYSQNNQRVPSLSY